jgi:hypothetical protein
LRCEINPEVRSVTHSAFDVQGGKSITDPMLISGRHRLIDGLSPRIVTTLTVLGFGLPLLGYFWFLQHYSLNAVLADQFSDVNVIKASYVQFFPWGPMWVQHFENRIFFPNIVVVLLAHTVAFNIQVEEFLSGVMLVVATIFIILAHRRRSPSTPWLYYCPVAILALSIVQYGDTLWGFQLAWYMVLLSLAGTVLILDRVTLTWLALVGALVVAIVGSFSSLQGLIIWPTGLVLLYFRRRPLSQIAVWIAVAAADAVVYFHNFDFATSSLYPQYARTHLFEALKFYLFAIGDVVGKPVGLGTSNSDNVLVILFGLVIVVLAVGTVLICGLRRDERSGSPVGIALIVYGLLFAAMITQGRSFLGLGAASFSRYTTFDILILVGIYLALLDRRRVISVSADSSSADELSSASDRCQANVRGAGRWVDRVALPCARIVLLVAIVVQVPLGIHYGLQGGKHQYAFNLKAANVLRNINQASNSEIRYYLYFLEPASTVREQARVLEEHHLSLFANG